MVRCLYFAAKPSVPVITGYWMYNWSKYIFTWTHAVNDLRFLTDYYAWYRNRYMFREVISILLHFVHFLVYHLPEVHFNGHFQPFSIFAWISRWTPTGFQGNVWAFWGGMFCKPDAFSDQR